MANHTRVKDCLTSAKITDYPFTCPIVRGEILFGIELLPAGRRRQSLEDQANNLFSGLICDLWIVATSLALDAILITSDSDFQRVQGLFGFHLEDWTT